MASTGWWERQVLVPVRRFWINLATRLGIRRTGLRKLRKEVKTSEYRDIHVMWEMLTRADSGNGQWLPPASGEIQRGERNKKGELWASLFHWAPHNLCRN